MRYTYNYREVGWAEYIPFAKIDFSVISTLSGNHSKINLKIGENSLKSTPETGDIILKDCKVEHKVFEQINANEHFFTYLAHKCGMKTSKQVLVQVEDDFLLFSERFDKNAYLYHLSELLELDCYTDFALKDFISFVDEKQLSGELKSDLGKQVFFDLLIGNLDTHANNFSVLVDGEYNVEISPMYDICHTETMIKKFTITPKHIICINEKNKNIDFSDLLIDLNLQEEDEMEFIKACYYICVSANLFLDEIKYSYIDPKEHDEVKRNIQKNINKYTREIIELSPTLLQNSKTKIDSLTYNFEVSKTLD
jgi:hypothetical protein